MMKVSVLIGVAALAVVLPCVWGDTLAAAKARLRVEKANLQKANIANEYIYDRNPNVLTQCTNNFKKSTDTAEFTNFLNAAVGKALGHTTRNMVVKQTLNLFMHEVLNAATTIQRVDRATTIIGCAITKTLGVGK